MSHISLTVSANNPVTAQVLAATVAAFAPGAQLSDRDAADYTAILAGTHEVFERVLAQDDYVPVVDEQRFSREDVHMPTAESNPSNAWAWKCRIKDEAAAGPLAGMAVCVKDNAAVAGVPCLLGTAVIDGWVPNVDATVVTRVLEAGGTVTGKAVCENMSYFGASISAPTGPIHNVHAPGYSAGGSSTGSAVLVARGECDAAIGGDQGGSIRLPAAHNGVVGLKPTHGLCPYTGIALLEATIDTTGPIAKDVLTTAKLLQAMAGADGIDDRQQAGCPLRDAVPDYPALALGGVKGLRVGIIAESLDSLKPSDPRYTQLVVDATKKFEALGATVGTASLPTFALSADIWMIVARLSAYQNMTGKACGRRSLYLNDFTKLWLPITQDKVDRMWPSMLATLTCGAYGWEHADATLMGKTMNLFRKVRDQVDAALQEYDVLVTPTMARLPARIDTYKGVDATSPLDKMRYAHGVAVNTCPFSVSGHPAISIPIGKLSPEDDADVSLPVGMQIIGKWWDEATVFRAAYAWEQAYDWKA